MWESQSRSRETDGRTGWACTSLHRVCARLYECDCDVVLTAEQRKQGVRDCVGVNEGGSPSRGVGRRSSRYESRPG